MQQKQHKQEIQKNNGNEIIPNSAKHRAAKNAE